MPCVRLSQNPSIGVTKQLATSFTSLILSLPGVAVVDTTSDMQVTPGVVSRSIFRGVFFLFSLSAFFFKYYYCHQWLSCKVILQFKGIQF